MSAPRLDRLSRALAHRHSRHVNRQEATPAVPDDAGGAPAPEMLFVQTYQSGTIAPVDGVEGRYTLSLEAGTGQTVYFSNRPDRLVGAKPTPQLLERLGFPDDNPPNAALVVETAPGETDVAVVELFAPLYDPVSQGVIYEVEVLENWQDELGVGLHDTPTDLAALAPAFGAAHLFIDGILDCPDGPIRCVYTQPGSEVIEYKEIASSEFGGFCSTYNWSNVVGRKDYCLPCNTLANSGNPEDEKARAESTWRQVCNERFPQQCYPFCEVEDFCYHDYGRDKPPCTWV